MKLLITRFKWAIAAGALSTVLISSTAFVNSHFEISKNLDIFATLYRELNLFYVDETNPGELMKTGIDAMLKSLDPYTNYIAESDIEDYRFMTTGQYGGIGAIIRQKDGYVVIAEPYENSPALKAGLLAGDIILEVDGKSAKDKTTEELSKALKGQPGTTVTLQVQRPGESGQLTRPVVREEIKIKDVPYYGMLKNDVGYIKLTSFTETASKEVGEALAALKKDNQLKGIVLDLRGNGGGLLREAVNIVNLFIDRGQEVVNTRGKVKEWDQSHKTLNAPMDLEIPVVVLVDRGSASASEIVSGTLQDLDRGVIVGRKTYGKGLVQQTRDLTYNAKLKVTVAKYYTPSGRCIQRIDYSKKNKEGRAEDIPDSLIHLFKTKNGRPVKDGEGITPDVMVGVPSLSNVTYALMSKMHVFDYATEYKRKHPELPKPSEFKLTEEEYKAFCEFVANKDYTYTTQAEGTLDEFAKVAKKESYLDDVNAEYEALKAKLVAHKKHDLQTFKPEITELIENEIISRYYHQKGRIESSLAVDDDVLKAIGILADKTTYSGILNGTWKQTDMPSPDETDEGDLYEEEE